VGVTGTPALKTFNMELPTITRHVDPTLESHDWFSLNKLSKAELMMMCQQRGIHTMFA
jgi:hypothetical protein